MLKTAALLKVFVDKLLAKFSKLHHTSHMPRRLLVAVLGCLHFVPLAHSASQTVQSDLQRLEQVFDRANSGRKQGRLKPERYEAFLIKFRAAVDQAWGVSLHSPADVAAYARLEARLGDPARAQSTLSEALKKNRKDPTLHLASGEIALQNREYANALTHAEAILRADPGNKRALALKHFSAGRTSGKTSVAPNSPSAPNIENLASNEDGRRASARQNAIHFAKQAQARLNINDPAEALRYATLAAASDPTYAAAQSIEERAAALIAASKNAAARSAPASNSRKTTWPLGGAAVGAGIAGAAFALRRKKEEQSAWKRPVMIVGVVCLCAITGGLLGLGLVMFTASAMEVGTATLLVTEGGTLTATALEGASAANSALALRVVAGAAATGAMVGARASQDLAPSVPQEESPSTSESGKAPKEIPFIPIDPAPAEEKTNECALKPGEDVLDRFIDGTKLAPGFLVKHEGRAIGLGHTIEEHVNVDLGYLQKRLTETPVDATPLKYASKFFNMKIAEDVIRRVVNEQKMQIGGWYMGSPKISEKFLYQGIRSIPIGQGISVQNISLPLSKFDARVILKRAAGCKIFVLTSFPE